MSPILDVSRHSTASFYYEGNKEVPSEVKYKRKEKYEPKLMVWAAVSSRGISYLAIFEEKTAMNTELYIAVITTYLTTFIEENHGDGKYIFWPDLAPCHYAKETLAKMAELGISFVPKEENSPAAPEVRSVEKFWAHLKAKVYANGWEAKNLDELESKIRKELRNFDGPYFKRLF